MPLDFTRKLSIVASCAVFAAMLGLPRNAAAGTCWNGGKSGAAPWYVTNSAGQASLVFADVNYCINSAAAEGDTIYVPAGNASWSSGLNVGKGVTIIGAGIGNTNITQSSGTFLNYSGQAGKNPTFRFSGFTINLNNSSTGFSLDCDRISPMQTNIRIDHNRIFNPSGATVSHPALENYGCRGVFDHNSVSNFDAAFRHWGDAYDGKFQWNNNPPLAYGALNDNFYFEDNRISNIGRGNTYMVSDADQGARFVYRYNTFENIVIYQMFDMHGGRGTLYGTMGAEIYGNQINGSNKNITEWRGGRLAAFYNNVTGGSSTFHAYNNDGCPATTVQLQNNGVVFGTRSNYSGSLIGVSVGEQACGSISEGGAYISDAGGNISCGSSLPTTCAVGKGYWLTNQSCSNLQGLVGDIETYPTRATITGTFYRCTSSNTWTASFTPMEYPHPLVQGTGRKPNPPAFIGVQ